MNQETVFAALQGVDTPTVCNALVRLDAELKGRNYSLDAVVPADAAMPSFTGYALTAKLVSSEPPTDDHQALLARRFAYYRYLGAARKPAMLVMQDCGERPGFGCWWGEINMSIHKAMGLRGCVTNGAIRDLAAVQPDFGLIGGNVCPGTGFAHLVEFDTPVKVFGLEVRPGDLVHADRHGLVVIPETVLAELPQMIAHVMDSEKTLLASLQAPGFGTEALVAAWTRFEATK